MASALVVQTADADHLAEVLDFDHVAAAGDVQRRQELHESVEQRRMRVAVRGDDVVGYAVLAPWFFGAAFVQLLYVAGGSRRHGIGSVLLSEVVSIAGPRVFTSTNLSNVAMQALLRRHRWAPCGMLHGLDEHDPEVFFTAPRAARAGRHAG